MKKKWMAVLLCGGMLFNLTACSNKKTEEDKTSSGEITELYDNTTLSSGYETTLFDTSYVHKINVEISEDDWEDLLENPLNKTKYEANVTIDGNLVEQVSFATKGNSSLSQVAMSDSNRYSFKINFGKFVDGQTYDGLDKLNLNNAMSDATYMKDYLSYEIMRAAGVETPLVSFVELSINGEVHGLYVAVEEVDDAFLLRNDDSSDSALYKPETEQLENMGQGFGGGNMELPEGFDQGNMEMPEGFDPENMEKPEGTGSGNMQKPEGTDEENIENPRQQEGSEEWKNGDMQTPGGFGFSGDNAGADLVYVDDEVESYSAIFDNIVNDVTEEDKEELIAALKALSTGENVEEYWDIDAVIQYFVAHNFVLNFDSYTGNMLHNYYLLEEDGKVSILPWDYNLAFGGYGMGMGMGIQKGANAGAEQEEDATTFVNWGIDSPLSGSTEDTRPLWNLIASNETYLEKYHEKYDELISEYFESGKLTEEVERISAMIREYVSADPTAFYTVEEFDKAVETLKSFCELRAESVRGQLSGEIPSTTEEQNADSSTLVDASGINISDMGSQGGEKGNAMPGGFQKEGENERNREPGK